MINPKELQLGNLIYHEVEGEIVVDKIENDRINDFDLHFFTGIPIMPEKLERLGFERKPVHSYNGNGADHQSETSKTELQDFVIDAFDEDYFFIRYITWSYRKDQKSPWSQEMSIEVHKGSWYENANEQVSCQTPEYIHEIQNLYSMLTKKNIKTNNNG